MEAHAQALFNSIWGENGQSQIGIGMKSIWSVTGDETVNGRVDKNKGVKGPRGMSKVVMPPAPALSHEVAKGGRLHMDELFNQMEELEMERLSIGSNLGLASTPFRQTKRGQFDCSGLHGMLQDVRTQFKLLKEFLNTVEEMREEVDSKAMSHSPVNMTALILEYLMDKKEEANTLRERFSRNLQKLFEDWDSKMSAIDRVLCPESTSSTDENNNVVVKLDVMPYLLKELGEVVRVSRIVVFTVQERYEEARRRQHS